MKVSKSPARLAIKSPLREVSLHFRESQITIKVRRPVPQCKPS